MIREGDIGENLFPDFPDVKVDFAEIGIGKIGKIGLAPPPKNMEVQNNPIFSESPCISKSTSMYILEFTLSIIISVC